jgi:hypothetical protein
MNHIPIKNIAPKKTKESKTGSANATLQGVGKNKANLFAD